MKRSLVIKYNDGTEPLELELKKAVKVKSDNEFIYFEKINGEWRLTFSVSSVDDFSKIDSFNILRDKVSSLSEKDMKESMEFRKKS